MGEWVEDDVRRSKAFHHPTFVCRRQLTVFWKSCSQLFAESFAALSGFLYRDSRACMTAWRAATDCGSESAMLKWWPEAEARSALAVSLLVL